MLLGCSKLSKTPLLLQWTTQSASKWPGTAPILTPPILLVLLLPSSSSAVKGTLLWSSGRTSWSTSPATPWPKSLELLGLSTAPTPTCGWAPAWLPLLTASSSQPAPPRSYSDLTAPAATLLFAKFLALGLPLRTWSIPELRVFLSKPDSPAEKHFLCFADFGKCQTKSSATMPEQHCVQYFLVDSFASKNSLAPFFDFQADVAPFHLQADRDCPLSPFRRRVNQMLLALGLSGSESTAQFDADRIRLAYTAHAPLPVFLRHFDPTPENETDRRRDFTRREITTA